MHRAKTPRIGAYKPLRPALFNAKNRLSLQRSVEAGEWDRQTDRDFVFYYY